MAGIFVVDMCPGVDCPRALALGGRLAGQVCAVYYYQVVSKSVWTCDEMRAGRSLDRRA